MIWRKLTNTTESMTKVTSAVISPVDDMHLWYHWMRTVHHLQSLLPKIGKPSINIRKAPDRAQFCLKIQISDFSRPSRTRKT